MSRTRRFYKRLVFASTICCFSQPRPLDYVGHTMLAFGRCFKKGSAFRLLLNGFEKFSTSRAATARIFDDPCEVVNDIVDGSVVLIGGFGPAGVPDHLIEGLARSGAKDLTVVCGEAGNGIYGLGMLMRNNQVKRVITSYAGNNVDLVRKYQSGEIELEFVPQGTLAERIRAGGAGIPSFFTPTGYGTLVHTGGLPIKYTSDGKVALESEPKEERIYNGKRCVLEECITGDFALVRAWKADRSGNLIFRKCARNFNPAMCKAGHVSIVEVDEIVEDGEIDPDNVHVPGILVHRLIKTSSHQQTIEKLRLRTQNANSKPTEIRERIIRRAALEVQDGMVVNLGVGMPTLIPNYVKSDLKIIFESENGIIGMGPYPDSFAEADSDVINAGKETVTVNKGSSFLSSDESFAIIRSGKIDLTILGAMQVSQFGDLASWIIPGKLVKGMGGAMDLVSASSKIIITMQHTAKGISKIVGNCTIPETGKKVVNMIITEMAVFLVCPDNGLTLIEIADDVTIEQVIAATDCSFRISDSLKIMGQATLGR